jgi:hypothetical protein
VINGEWGVRRALISLVSRFSLFFTLRSYLSTLLSIIFSLRLFQNFSFWNRLLYFYFLFFNTCIWHPQP